MLSLVHLIYMAGDKCMRQNAFFFIECQCTQFRDLVQFLKFS